MTVSLVACLCMSITIITHWNNATIYLLLHDKLLYIMATAVTLQLSFETFTF